MMGNNENNHLSFFEGVYIKAKTFYLCLISWTLRQLDHWKPFAGYSLCTPSVEIKNCHFIVGKKFMLLFHTETRIKTKWTH